jgi:hypothetical protein
MQKRTTLADREEIVALKRSGLTCDQIPDKTGWSKETVRRVWRAYRDHGPAGLLTQPLGWPATGPMSTFDPLVRYVALRLKLGHRKHGGERLVTPRRHLQLPRESTQLKPRAAAISAIRTLPSSTSGSAARNFSTSCSIEKSGSALLIEPR